MRKMVKIFIMIFMIAGFVRESYSIHISPINFEKRIDNGEGYMEYRLPNGTGETIRYKISVSPGEAKKDMHKWIDVYPKVLTIKPGKTGILKLFAKSPEEAEEGPYSFHLNLETVPVPRLGDAEGKIKAGSGISIGASIEMIGYVGDLKPELAITGHRIYEENGSPRMELKVKNLSDKRGVEYGIEVEGKNNKKIKGFKGRIPKETEETVVLNLESLGTKRIHQVKLYEDISFKELTKVRL